MRAGGTFQARILGRGAEEFLCADMALFPPSFVGPKDGGWVAGRDPEPVQVGRSGSSVFRIPFLMLRSTFGYLRTVSQKTVKSVSKPEV